MQVCGTGTARKWVAAAADLFGGTACDCPIGNGKNGACAALDGKGITGPVVVMLRGCDLECMLRRALAQGSYICYALDENFDIAALRRPHPVLGATGLIAGLCLSARTTYELPVASIIANTVAQHAHLSDVTRLNMDIALSEAVANALLHGCLELDSPEERFDPAFVAEIESRIDNPVYSSRPIWVAVYRDMNAETGSTLRVLVADEGAGFQPKTHLDFSSPECASRGTGLIHAAADEVTYSDNGRCLEMKFSL